MGKRNFSEDWFYEFNTIIDANNWWKKHVNNIIVYGTKK
jgi:hypothetical protein